MSNIVPIQSGGKLAGIIPQTFEDVQRVAKCIAASGLAPQGLKSESAITVALMHGLELGLPPMASLQKIAVINGRPSIWGDAIPALLWARGFKLVEKELIASNTVGEVNGWECTVIRPDGTEIKRKFTRKDAKDAGLLGKSGPWKQYEKRMLQMRARGLAARDGAADVLSGLYLVEEAQDIVEAEPIHLEAEPPETHGSDSNEPDSHELDWLSNCEAFAPHDERPNANRFNAAGGYDTWAELTGQINDCKSRDQLRHIVVETYFDEIGGLPFGHANMLISEYIIPKWEALP